MVKNKILVALGTRPELINLAPVINRLHKSIIIYLILEKTHNVTSTATTAIIAVELSFQNLVKSHISLKMQNIKK